MRPVQGQLFDAAIVGGGPAGSTTAAYLQMNGYHTVLLEKAKFPRFHIGESLLPWNLEIFEELGIHDRLHESGAIPKHGAEFRSHCGRHVRRFYFRDSLHSDRPLAYQVLRSEFDALLLARAREGGADVREESPVTGVIRREDHQGYVLEVEPRQGAAYRLRSRCLVDASGQDTFLATRLGLKRLDPEHRRYAVFGHFRGAARSEGEDAGNIIIVPFGEGHWLWSIPLPGDRTSIGAVVTRALVAEHRDDLEGFLLRTIHETPALEARIRDEGLELTETVRAAADFSYECSRYAGDGFVLVGDAAAFLDPVFSSGVLLAMSSARDAAAAIHRALQRGDVSRNAFRAYERRHRRRVRTIGRLIRAFYRPAFLEMFMNPTDVLKLRSAVTTLLSGELDTRLGARLRLEVFYLIGKLRRLAVSHYPENGPCTLGCSAHSKARA